MNRGLKIVLALAAALALQGNAAAQAYPGKPIRIMVGFAAGAATDQLARIIGARLSQNIGQPVLIENRAGAGGTIAADATAKAAPDGYTLLLGEPGSMVVAPAMMKGLAYDPVKSFEPVGQVISITFLIVAHPASGLKSLADLKKQDGGKPLPYGSAGTGTMQHLAVELLKKESGLRFEHVAYKGGAPALNDLLGGQIPLLVITAGTIVPYVKAGKVVPLVVLNATRSRFFPDVPTAKESGYPDYSVDGWQGFFAPAGTPREIVARLNAEIRKVVETPEVAQTMLNAGHEPATGTSAEFAKKVREDGARWGRVVRDVGLSPN